MAQGIIPREILFGNPERAMPQISPDGKKVAWLAPNDKNVLNIYVKDIDAPDSEARLVTNDKKRGIREWFWLYQDGKLGYLQDADGDENFHCFSVDIETKIVRDLSPFQDTRADDVHTNKHFPNTILIGMNVRNKTVFDMYRVDIDTGACVLDTENDGTVILWYTDAKFVIRAALSTDPTTGNKRLRVRDSQDAPWREIMTWDMDDMCFPVAFTLDGTGLYLRSTIGRDTMALVEVGVEDGSFRRTIFEDERVDVGDVGIDEDTHEVLYATSTYLRRTFTFYDKGVEEDFVLLETKFPDQEPRLVNETSDKSKWVVSLTSDVKSTEYYILDRKTKALTFLFASQPKLNEWALSKMEGVEITARDGLVLTAYLTSPDNDRAKNADGKYPLVLLVHGGPWARDSWGFNSWAQWLSNRGYAVLQVNFRSSTGFGKSFVMKGNLQWGADMQSDLTDAAEWAVKNRNVDPKRVAIAGGSYGGYATLAGLVFTPEVYACGVDIVGPVNLRTLLQTIPPYWAPEKKRLIHRLGDCENDEALNRKVSPLFHVDKIRAPLLIGQGANDPRVKQSESDQIAEALEEKKIDYEYVVYTDEGHGFARPENRLDFNGRMEEFLAKHLGGAVEPHTNVAGSTALQTGLGLPPIPKKDA